MNMILLSCMAKDTLQEYLNCNREARKSDVTTKAETLEDARLLVGKIDVVSTSQECRQPLEGGKGREMDHSEPPEETQSCQHLISDF